MSHTYRLVGCVYLQNTYQVVGCQQIGLRRLALSKNTRDSLLEHAEALFAKKGFYGTSIKDVAAEVCVSKQGLLHHFPTKEKLYAAVLCEATVYISAYVDEVVDQTKNDEPLVGIFEGLLNAQGRTYQVIVLLLRELLDNPERASTSNQWFMRPFLDQLTQIAKSSQGRDVLSDDDALALVYHLLGATQYFLISQPTLCALYSKDEVANLKARQLEMVKQICR